MFLGAWSILPPYLGPAVGLELDVRSSVEVVDHVIPGSIVVLCGGLSILLARRAPEEESLLLLTATGACVLAGLWETVTHVPLVFEAGGSDAPWGSVLLHSTPGPPILAIALWLLVRAPAPEPGHDRSPA